mgnify:CR=1 FL=1
MSKMINGRIAEIQERDIEVSASAVLVKAGKIGMYATLQSADVESIISQISTNELLDFIGKEEVKNWLDDSDVLSLAAS